MKRKTQEDATVFVCLVREHKRAVYAAAYAKMRNVHDAEDVTQDVFVEAYQNLKRLKNPEKIRPWLYKVTACRCTDNLRKMRRRQRREGIYADSTSNNPSDNPLIAEERRSAVLEAIGLVSEEQRVIVMLKYFARLSYADISMTTGLSRATVSNRLQSAKRKMRKHLTKVSEGVG